MGHPALVRHRTEPAVKQNERFTSVIEIESRRKHSAEEEDDGED
jgi:hypothetical protein